MRYVMGIDHGGSKTCAMISDEQGHIIGLGQENGSGPAPSGTMSGMQCVKYAAEGALTQAGLTMSAISRVTAGMTGVDWPSDAERMTLELSGALNCPAERIEVVNDCIIALRAGTRKKSGCILCAGTGMNCAVVKDGRTEYIFGFYVSGRDQGGSALSRRALQAVFDTQAGLIPHTCLTQLVLDHFRVGTVDELLFQHSGEGLPYRELLQLPILLEKAAVQDDAVALSLLDQFGRDIARYVVAGLRKVDMLGWDIDVVLSGSILKCQAPILKDAIVAEIHRHTCRAHMVDSYLEPVAGGVLMGLEHILSELSDDVYGQIERDSQQLFMVRRKTGQ